MLSLWPLRPMGAQLCLCGSWLRTPATSASEPVAIRATCHLARANSALATFSSSSPGTWEQRQIGVQTLYVAFSTGRTYDASGLPPYPCSKCGKVVCHHRQLLLQGLPSRSVPGLIQFGGSGIAVWVAHRCPPSHFLMLRWGQTRVVAPVMSFGSSAQGCSMPGRPSLSFLTKPWPLPSGLPVPLTLGQASYEGFPSLPPSIPNSTDPKFSNNICACSLRGEKS